MGIHLESAATATRPQEADRTGHAAAGRRHPSRTKGLQAMVIGFIAMALIVTGALIGLALYTKWQDALVAQERQGANLARVLQEQTLRVLHPIDLATQRMRDAVANGSL